MKEKNNLEKYMYANFRDNFVCSMNIHWKQRNNSTEKCSNFNHKKPRDQVTKIEKEYSLTTS